MSEYEIDEEEVIRAKVVLLGSAGVGKTCLVIKYKTGNFPNMPSPTIGASYMAKTVQIKNHKLKLQMWDTAGQERFQSMASMYYRGADAAILVFDLTDKKSLLAVKHWVRELREHNDVSDNIVLSIAANKCDIASKNQNSQTLFSEAREYASDIEASLFRTSAKTSQGINQIFDHTAQQILKIKLKNNNNNQINKNLILEDPKNNKKICCNLI